MSTSIKKAITFLACFAVIMAGSWLVSAPSIATADDGTRSSPSQKLVLFEDVTVGPNEVWDNVVVVGGDVLVQGTVNKVLAVVGGNLTIGPHASIGAGISPDDAAIVSVFGNVYREGGGAVYGRTVDVAGSISNEAHAAFVDPILRTWRVGAVVSWGLSSILLLLAALVAAAVAPRQVAVVRDRVRNHFLSSLGWGALGAVVVVPIVTVLLIVTIVGVVIAVPWLVVGLPLISLFGLAAVGAAIGRMVLRPRADGRESVVAAAVLGLLIATMVRWIPVVGAAVLVLLWLAGFGATYMAIWSWIRTRHQRSQPKPESPNF